MTDPLVLRSLFGPEADLDALPWTSFRAGVEIVTLSGSLRSGPASALLRYAPGGQVPAHRHVGFEHVLILRGSQADERGVYEAGTLVVNPPGTSHSVRSESGCIALLVWEKPVVFI